MCVTAKLSFTPLPAGATSEVSIHVQGMEWVQGSQDEAHSLVRINSSLLCRSGSPIPKHTLYLGGEEGTFLLYTMAIQLPSPIN